RFVLVVDTDTREILSFSITDEKTGEVPQFERLTREALENAGVGAGARGEKPGQAAGRAPRDGGTKVAMRADGGFDSHRIFDLCANLGITPYIRVGPNSATRSRGVGRARTNVVLDQLGGGIRDPREFAMLTADEKEANRRKWKERVRYGERWLVEIVISSFKRLFGDFVRAVRWENVVQEMNLKVHIYNRMLTMA
ncbi:MAG: transposase, partial [Nitrosopumilaceae archaeon]|nr:transposase [Nitrosopumilaceae archaeon]